MPAYEGAAPQMLHGVSQQIPRARLPGQVTAQLNCLSDPVTGLRRRPGVQQQFDFALTDATATSIKAWYADVAGAQVHVVLNCADGTVKILGSDYGVLATLAGGAYLTSANPSTIRATTVGNEMFLLNTAVVPTEVAAAAGTDPTMRGFFFIAAGAFNKTYTVEIQSSVGTISASYTTPTGAAAGDAALSTPEYIAQQLTATLDAAKATAGLASVTRTSAYVYTQGSVGTTAVVVNSPTGSVYVVVSKDSYVLTTGSLPAQLPAGADGYVMRVGDVRVPQYFAYNSTSTAWLESGAYGSPAGIENMPVSITKVAGTWTLVTDDFEGRLAGDDDTASNPSPKFLEYGITGMGTYQGRLVLLGGPYVRLSASNKPRRMYRSTVTAIIDSDPIEVSSSANSSASYEYAEPFQKDLLLWSRGYQALIPSGNTAITPRTATVVLTSTHATDTTASPVALGRTVMYASPVSTDFFGVLEMVPSSSTDSQYISSPATEHLPKYLAGRCRFAVASSVISMVLFAPSGDTNSLVVYEYVWDGDKKVQQAWHTWTFQYPIASAYFAADKIVLLFVQNEHVVGGVLDPKIGQFTEAVTRRPFMDLYDDVTITANEVTVPTWLQAFDPAGYADVSLARTTGALAGELVGIDTRSATTLTTVRSQDSGVAAIGFTYQSLVSPTPPVLRDYKDEPITTDQHTLLRFIVGTKNSAEYKVSVTDANSEAGGDLSIGTLYWSSAELDIGVARVAGESSAVVPCRTDADSTVVSLYTNGLGELNITSLEHVGKFIMKIKRR